VSLFLLLFESIQGNNIELTKEEREKNCSFNRIWR